MYQHEVEVQGCLGCLLSVGAFGCLIFINFAIPILIIAGGIWLAAQMGAF